MLRHFLDLVLTDAVQGFLGAGPYCARQLQGDLSTASGEVLGEFGHWRGAEK